MPHPRQLISKNYHHLGSHPLLSNLFPRENFIGGTRRLKNLSEFLSPSVQQSAGVGTDNDPGNDDDDTGPVGGGHWNSSYHCPSFKTKCKCDVCSHMVETSAIYSLYFKRKFAIHGQNLQLHAAQKNKLMWFIYCREDTVCNLQYIGSTVDV